MVSFVADLLLNEAWLLSTSHHPCRLLLAQFGLVADSSAFIYLFNEKFGGTAA